jgi:hypothetical protein
VLRLTPEQWGAKSVHERRALITWTEQRIKALSEKYAFMLRSSRPVDAEIPGYLRERA